MRFSKLFGNKAELNKCTLDLKMANTKIESLEKANTDLTQKLSISQWKCDSLQAELSRLKKETECLP